MNNKIVGGIFCFISALLQSARYIANTIWTTEHDGIDISDTSLGTTDIRMLCIEIIALIIGVVFLGFGIYQDRKK